MKYDGSLRDEYESSLVSETNEIITIFSPPGVRYLDHLRSSWLEAPDGLIELYFKNRYYNVWHICEQISQVNLMYINICQPAIIYESQIEWVDLDLDYRVHLDNRVEFLDQDEFEQNRRKMGYPSELIKQVHLACREVEAGLASRVYPFDHENQEKLYKRIKSELLTS